ncbi:hypothetical protein CGRA01v4_00713 [Colletotrichum graminicola]|nr:hypothetical protein CGRA01v4_00713 [Colletotrichum graminicola]
MTSTSSSVPHSNLARHFFAGHLAMHWAVAGIGRGLDRTERPGEVKCPWIADEVLRFFCSCFAIPSFLFWPFPCPPPAIFSFFLSFLDMAAVVRGKKNVVPNGDHQADSPQYG